MIDDNTSQLLRTLATRYETSAFIDGDPSWWMHQVYHTDNQESIAFIASALSYGSRAQFMPKIGLILSQSGGEVARWVGDGSYKDLFSPNDNSSYYRLYSHSTMYTFLDAYRQLLLQHGTLGGYLRCCGDGTGLKAVELICQWFATHGQSPVVPHDTSSACKRLCMFLRWMVRDNSPVDLGLWSDFIDKRTLVMPLDTHVVSQSIRLGLLQSRCASMRAALRLTAIMSEIFPDDPLRGDFALFGYGVNSTTA